MCVGRPAVQVRDDKLGGCGGAEEKEADFPDMYKMNWEWIYEGEGAAYAVCMTGWNMC